MKKTLLLAGVAALVAANASAAEIKPYVGLDYVYSMADIDKVDGYQLFEEDVDAFAVSAGAKLHENFGVEAFYQQSGEGKNTDTIAGISGVSKFEYKAYGLDVIGYLPVTQKLELLGSLGVGYYDVDAKLKITAPVEGHSSTSDDGWAWRIGAGAQYNFTENWGARVMARYADLDIDGIDNIVDLTAGIRYSF